MNLERKRNVTKSLIAAIGSAIANKQWVEFDGDELEVLLAACRQYETLDRLTALNSVAKNLATGLNSMIDIFERHITGRPGPDDVATRWDNAREALVEYQFLMSRPEGADRVAG